MICGLQMRRNKRKRRILSCSALSSYYDINYQLYALNDVIKYDGNTARDSQKIKIVKHQCLHLNFIVDFKVLKMNLFFVFFVQLRSLYKQISNTILYPYMFTNTLVSENEHKTLVNNKFIRLTNITDRINVVDTL